MCALRHIRNEHEADKRVVSASPGASPSGVLHSHLGMHAEQRRTRRDQLPAGQAILVTRHGHRRALACALAHVHDPTREPAVARLVALRYRQFNNSIKHRRYPQALVVRKSKKHNTACDSRETAKEPAPPQSHPWVSTSASPPSPRRKCLNTVRSLSAKKIPPFKTSQIRIGCSW